MNMLYDVLKCELCEENCCRDKGEKYYRFVDKENIVDEVFKSIVSGEFLGSEIWKFSPGENGHGYCTFFKEGRCTYKSEDSLKERMPICDTYPFYVDRFNQLVISMECPSYVRVLDALKNPNSELQTLNILKEIKNYLLNYRKDHLEYMKKIVGDYKYFLVLKC